MLSAGHPHADDDVGALARVASAWTTPVFNTEALALRGGGAACHRARRNLPSTVFGTMLESVSCVGGAPFGCARSMCTMLVAETPCCSKSVAVFHFALFRVAAAVPDTPSFTLRGSLAIAKRAEPIRAVLATDPVASSSCNTPCS